MQVLLVQRSSRSNKYILLNSSLYHNMSRETCKWRRHGERNKYSKTLSLRRVRRTVKWVSREIRVCKVSAGITFYRLFIIHDHLSLQSNAVWHPPHPNGLLSHHESLLNLGSEQPWYPERKCVAILSIPFTHSRRDYLIYIGLSGRVCRIGDDCLSFIYYDIRIVADLSFKWVSLLFGKRRSSSAKMATLDRSFRGTSDGFRPDGFYLVQIIEF